ncbi:hypothetical protein LXD69_06275 [Flavobacterium sediminilitoris]|uniref:Uncharacterized protein n=1 Tax=Flavobacterium sediminilitoris TaxID=2024526 RepID=A0ABY4HQG9_9FLAO|nr:MULTISPECIES: hypothetical protein [Flavobacterium]UOX35115.1 hypothetical protein LXD69_06275 [Flavobacterium sediminilitoris]
MKHEIKRLNLFVIAVLALFWSCQFEEEGVMQEQLHEESFTIERINGDVFRARAPKAFGKVLFLQKSMVDATENKSVAIDGVFSVETDEVLQITKGNRVSYTLPVYRFDESDLVENLVLTWQGEAGYSAKIISYILTDEERSAIEGGFFVDVSKKMLIWSLDDGNGVFSSVLNKSSSGDCFKTTIAYDMCCHNVHNTLDVQNGARCTCPSPPTGYTYVIESVSCDDDGGGGWEDPVSIDPIHSVPGDGQGSIGGGTPGESGGGTAPDDPTNTDNDPVDHFEDDLTLPVLVVRDPPTPCEILKNQTIDNLAFNSKLDSLKQLVLTTNPDYDTTETMVNVKRLDNEYIYSVTNNSSANNAYISVKGNMTNRDVASIHNHPVNSIPVFSYVDIVSYYDTYTFVLDSRKNEYTDYVVCFNNTTYALRMENPTALANLFMGLDLATVEGREKANNIVLKVFEDYNLEINEDYTQSMAEELFMNVLYDEKMGGGNAVNLYRKDDDGWGKLIKNGNNIQKIPCSF